MSQKRLPYGVAYSPNEITDLGQFLPVADFLDDMKYTDIRYVRVQWVDFSNHIRYKVLSRSYFSKLVSRSGRPGITLAAAVMSIIAGACAPGSTGIGEWLYVFDLQTLRRAEYNPGHAVVMGYFQEETPHLTRGLYIPLCPRSILKKVVE